MLDKKPQKKSYIPIIVVIVIALLIAAVLPSLREAEQFSDTKDV